MAAWTLFPIVILAQIATCEVLVPAQDTRLLSLHEKALIKQLRERVKENVTQPIMSENGYLIRFLRAQKHDLDRAEKMIQEMLAWREEEKMDTIFAEDWSAWLANYPFTLNMHDREGRRAFSTSIGKMDIRRLVTEGKQKEFHRYMLYGFERSLYNIHEGWKETGFIDGYLLLNMAGYSARTHACLACVLSWINLGRYYERYYPHTSLKVFAINIPRIFLALFEVIRPTFSSDTARILHLYDYSNANWKKELFKIFSENVLTPEFGGTGPIVEAKSLHKKDISRLIYYNNQTILDIRKA